MKKFIVLFSLTFILYACYDIERTTNGVEVINSTNDTVYVDYYGIKTIKSILHKNNLVVQIPLETHNYDNDGISVSKLLDETNKLRIYKVDIDDTTFISTSQINESNNWIHNVNIDMSSKWNYYSFKITENMFK